MSAISALYGRAAALRRRWYVSRPSRRRRLACPVLSVGNLVVGGSGKTPTVAAIARLLDTLGERPAILSRGYGRTKASAGVVVVSDGHQVLATTAQSGDEPQMLGRALPRVPVLVCPDRYLAGRAAVDRFQTTVALLDDGFQHVTLARDIDLLLVSPGDLDERPLPSGRLREPLSVAREADALLVPGSAEDAARVGAALGVETVFRIAHHYQPPRLVHPFGEALPARPPSACPQCAVAVAAIARPDRFFSAAVDEGWNVRREISFRDHHWFTLRDVEQIVAQAHDVAAEVILTTEKDAVRLEGLIPADGPAWAYMPMAVTIEPFEAFRDWLVDRLRAARAGAR